MPYLDRVATNTVYTDPQVYVAPTVAQAYKCQGPLHDNLGGHNPYALLCIIGWQAAFDGLMYHVWYAWDADSTAADDPIADTVYKPTAIANTSPGRWIAFDCTCVLRD